jgi:hypothetical protein
MSAGLPAADVDEDLSLLGVGLLDVGLLGM